MKIVKSPGLFIIITFFAALVNVSCNNSQSGTAKTNKKDIGSKDSAPGTQVTQLPLDTLDFNKKLKAMSNGDTTNRWPTTMPAVAVIASC